MKIKILFIVPSLNSGGAERVISLLCNNLNKNKFEIILGVLKKEGIFLEQISKDIKIVDLKEKHVRNSFFKIKKLIIQEKPDIVFSTLSHLNLFISIFKFLLPKNSIYIGRESSIISEDKKKKKFGKFILEKLYTIFYKKLDYIICQSSYMANDLIENYKVKKSKIKVIGNPVDIEKILFLSEEKTEVIVSKEKINLVTIGRLEPVKQHCYLIDMFSKLDKKLYHLYIIGEGSEKIRIEKKIKELGLEKNISLLGRKKNPFSIIKQCDIFILTSKYEGFPNVVLEALALNLPILSLKSPGGVLEIIKEGKNGYFFEEKTFKKKILKILKINKNQISRSIVNYKKNKIIKEYEKQLFDISLTKIREIK